MSEKVHIGFVCGKGNGHTQFRGGLDYGCCGGKRVADVYVTVEELEDLYPEYRGLKSSADVAEELADIVEEWDRQRESEMWDALDKD